MEDIMETADQTHEKECNAPEAQADGEPAAPVDSEPAGDEKRIAHLVRTEVEKCLAQIFPAAREAPRAGMDESQLTSREFLRLGYGAQAPQN